MKIRRFVFILALIASFTGWQVGAGAAPRLGARQDPLQPAVTENVWFPLGGGLNAEVDAIAVAGTNIYVGGLFTDAGGDPNGDYIAMWNGSSWQALGSGLNGKVYAIAVIGSNIYVGGNFTDAGGQANADHIASWDGSAWHALGNGLSDTVASLAVAGNVLYAGGSFQDAGGDPNGDNIARWEAGAWHAFPNYPQGAVMALTVDGSGRLYAGGLFMQADNNPNASRIAYWDGAHWQPLGTGFSQAVYALTSIGTDVYAGGAFQDAGGDPAADYLARWDGSAWHAVGLITANIYTLAAAGDVLYAGGTWYARRWDGSTWHYLSDNLPATYFALAVTDYGVYAGGVFEDLGGETGDRIAMWKGISIDNNQILYSTYNQNDGSRQVNIVSGFSQDDRTLINNASHPRLSPDHNYVAFLRGSTYPPDYQNDLYVMNLSNYAVTRVYQNNDYIVGFDWTSDSRNIIFDYGCTLYQVNLDGSGLADVANDGNCNNDAPAVNQTNGDIAYHNINRGIILADKLGGNADPIPNTQPGDRWPSFSPDGQWIAFIRFGSLPKSSGNYYKIHPDGSGLTQLTFIPNGAYNKVMPAAPWTTSGDNLITPIKIAGVTKIYAIRTSGGAGLSLVNSSYAANADFVGSMVGGVMPWRTKVFLPAIIQSINP